jgi:anti-anti-sigma factor
MSDARDTSIVIERVGGGVVARVGVAEPEDEDLERMERLIGASAAEAAVGVVVVDLSRVTILPSHGLGTLVKLSGECEGRGKRLRLAGVSEQLRETLRVTRLDRVLRVVGSVEDGLG